MSWKLRHEGSPRAMEGLTLQQVVEGLQDGRWELSDEVMGPQDQTWVPIEAHPALAEVVADLEPITAPRHDDETRLDMTALIDVTLVLLIFFILTITYGALEKLLSAPAGAGTKPRPAKADEVRKTMITVQLVRRNQAVAIDVESGGVAKTDVKPEELVDTLQSMKGEKNALLVYWPQDLNAVQWGQVVAIYNAAEKVGISDVNLWVPPGTLTPTPPGP